MVRKNIIPMIGLMLVIVSQLCFADDAELGIAEDSLEAGQEATPGITSGAIETRIDVAPTSYAPTGVAMVSSFNEPREQAAPTAVIVQQSEQQYEQVAPTAVMVNPFGEPQEALAPQAVAVDQLREQAAPKAIVVDNTPQKGPAPVAIPVPVNQLQGVVVGQPVQSPASAGTVYGSPNPVKKMLAPVNVAVQGVNVNKSAPAPQSMRAAPAGIVRATQK